jgi:hypothetical protein
MPGASVNTAITKGKFNRHGSDFGSLQLKIPDNDSLFPLWRRSPHGAYVALLSFLNHN